MALIGDQWRRLDALELLVGEIQSIQIDENNDNLSLSIRNALERGWFLSFKDALEDSKQKKEVGIDKICSRHYGDFLSSVKELIMMRLSAIELKAVVKEINNEFHTTGSDLITILLELEKYQKDILKTKNIIESIRVCRELSIYMCVANDQIDNNEHYAAMYTIQTLLKEVQSVTIQPMAKKLSMWLPKAISSLLLSAKQEAETFLAFSINSAVAVGETILRRRAMALITSDRPSSSENRNKTGSYFVTINSQSEGSKHQNQHKDKVNIDAANDNKVDSTFEIEQTVGTSSSVQYTEIFGGHIFELEKWLQINDLNDIIPTDYLSPPTARGILLTDSISTELGALHKSLHMHNVLDQAELFKTNYRILRLPIVNNFFKKADKLVTQKVRLNLVLPTLLANIIGFFLFENIFQQCAVYKNGPFSNIELTVLWDEMCSKLDQFLLKWTTTLMRPEEMLMLKEDLLLFIETSNDCIFQFKNSHQKDKDNELITVLNSLWPRFEEIQLKATIKRCKDALENSLYQPLSVTSETQYLREIKAFAIHNLNYNEIDKGKVESGLGRVSTHTTSSSPHQRHERKTNGMTNDEDPSTIHGVNSPDSQVNTAQNMNRDTGAISPRAYVSTSVASDNLDALEDMLMLRESRGTSSGHQTVTGNSINSGGSSNSINSGGLNDTTMRAEMRTDSNYSPRDFIDTNSSSLTSAINTQQISPRIDQQESTSLLSLNPTLNIKTFIPKIFPFSSAVPGVLREFHLLLLRFFIFSVKNVSLESKGELICGSVLKIFRFINSFFQNELEREDGDIPLSKACQISIDASSIVLASESIWSLVSNVLDHFGWGSSISSHLLPALSTVRAGLIKITLQAQDLAFELLANKVNDLLESSLMFINFEPETLPKIAHEMTDQLIDFLTVTLMWLTHLPSAAREAAHFTCCSRVSGSILSYILSPRVEKINVFCIIGLDLDAKKLEQFADSCGIAHLRQCFAELKELVRATLHPDLHQMADNINLRKSLFPRLDPLRLATLLDKVTPTPLGAVSQSSNLPLMERRFLQPIVKKLRTQGSH